jgi:hypothetical protein
LEYCEEVQDSNVTRLNDLGRGWADFQPIVAFLGMKREADEEQCCRGYAQELVHELRIPECAVDSLLLNMLNI